MRKTRHHVGAVQAGRTDGAVSPKGSGVYRIELALREGTWHRNFTTYGLSIAGAFLWALGVPVSYGHVVLSFEATVYDPHDVELGCRTFSERVRLIESSYAGHMFARRLPRLYARISPDIRKFVEESIRKSVPRTESNEDRALKPSKPTRSTNSVSERLRELEQLRRDGLLSGQEYEAKRKQILDDL